MASGMSRPGARHGAGLVEVTWLHGQEQTLDRIKAGEALRRLSGNEVGGLPVGVIDKFWQQKPLDAAFHGT